MEAGQGQSNKVVYFAFPPQPREQSVDTVSIWTVRSQILHSQILCDGKHPQMWLSWYLPLGITIYLLQENKLCLWTLDWNREAVGLRTGTITKDKVT